MKQSFYVMWLLLSVAILATGCGKSENATPAKGEAELFSQAQEFQKNEAFKEAVDTYRKIIREHGDSKQASNSQFMIGYIYANHIKDYEQAKIELNRFIEKYGPSADSGLVAGAQFELQYLGKSIDEIPILSDIGEDQTASTDSTK